MYQFSKDNRLFWFTYKHQAVKWALQYALDNGYKFKEPVERSGGWVVEVVRD